MNRGCLLIYSIPCMMAVTCTEAKGHVIAPSEPAYCTFMCTIPHVLFLDFLFRITCLAGHTSVSWKEIKWNRQMHSSTLCWLR